MSESSRSSFTVTLGRNGRVVKRGGGLSEEGFQNDSQMTGIKRSIRDRLGGNSDERHHPYSKRQRAEGLGTSSVNDMHLHKGDLRFKLMRKSSSQQSQNSDSRRNIDLRDTLLSRSSHSSVENKVMRPPVSVVSTRQPVLQPRDTGVIRQTMIASRDASILGRYPSSRNPSDSSVMDPGRSYSSWTLDNLRQRSPDRLYRSSARGGLSPERSSRDELQRRTIRAYDDGRSGSGLRISPPRPVSSSLYVTKSSLAAAPVKSSMPLPPHYPQGSGMVRKFPSMGDEPVTVESFLHSLGLEKYTISFKAEEIDMKTLKQLGDNDLKELGIPMGPRKKIIQSLMPRPRRPL